MADLNSTIVRGKLKVTDTIATNGDINTSGNLYAATVYSNGVALSDTKNTAGSTNSTAKLFLIGAGAQQANPQTYSNSKVSMTDGALTIGDYTSTDTYLNLIIDSTGIHHHGSMTNSGYIGLRNAQLELGNDYGGGYGLVLSKTNIVRKTAPTTTYTLTFPDATGTIAVKKYKHNITFYGSVSSGPQGNVYCTFSFISDSATAITTLANLLPALTTNFKNKLCPATGLWGYNSNGSIGLELIVGVEVNNSNNFTFAYMPIAETNSSNTMTVSASASIPTIQSYPVTAGTITDTVEDC